MLQRLLILILVCAPLAVSAQPGAQFVQTIEGISEYRLANGLQVLLVPDDAKPTTTVNMTYRVGSRHENYGESGMAHLLEHLMFKGSPKHPEVWAEFTKRGLRANGTTGFDRTNYFASFAANDENLKWYLEWQADAMTNSFIARKDLDTEMTVVRNEMERGENNPQRVLWQRALASMYQWHNYGKVTIGARSDVENVDIPRLRAFYRMYYQPDNATLVVSGKFNPKHVLNTVMASFGKLAKPKRTLPKLYTLEPVQDGESSYTVRRSGGVPMLLASYHAPAAAHPDYAACEALALILGDEPSGRLYKQLVQTQHAASVWGWSWDLFDPGVMMFGAQLAPGQNVEAARSELLAGVESLSRQPVTSEELERARAKWLNEWTRRFSNAEAVGVALSDAVGQGDWRLFFLLRDRMRDLKLAEVQRAAAQYLLPSNRVLGLYLPTEQPLRAPPLERVDVAGMLQGYKGDAAWTPAEVFDATVANIEARTQRFSLDSGMQVALLPKGARGQVVQAQLTLRYGAAESLVGVGDVPSFTAAMLDRGTAKLSRQQIEDRFAALKAQVHFGGTPTYVAVSITTVRDNLPAVIELVGELLRESNFPADALEELRARALADLEAQRKEPEALVANTLGRHGNPYPRGDVRYARTFDEMLADLQAVTLEQVSGFHAKFYGAGNAQFGASGDMDAAVVRKALQTAFGDWQSATPYARIPTPLVQVPPERFVLRTPDKQNATMAVRLALGLTDNDGEYPSFMLANALLGWGGNSRLWLRLREQEGLSYDARSGVDWSSHEPNSLWQASAIFAPQNQPQVEAAFRQEIARVLKDGFTQRELDQARKGLLSARQLSRAQDANLASALANNLYLGRTFMVSQRVDEMIAQATLQEVNAALRKYLKPAQFVFAFGGDFKP
ncbi:MAG: insulinase family protein [Burkholderiaceae bacterium]|nr:insulinase family protein [Burkholderiaceae bacterium]